MQMQTDLHPVPISSAAPVTAFFRAVYGKMAAGLVVTAITAAATLGSPLMQQTLVGNRLVFYGLLLVEIALVIWLSAAIRKLSPFHASVLFFLYSALNGVTISGLLALYTGASVVSTFMVTAGMFGAVSCYGALTKRDISGWGGFLVMGLIGLIIASLVNMFMHSPIIYWVSTWIGVLVFTGLTAHDTQKLKTLQSELGQNAATMGALQLYLDFVNILILMLRLMGGRK